jgi:hypothetical protein
VSSNARCTRQVAVADLMADLPLLANVYASAPAVLGRALPPRCAPRLRLFFEGAAEALAAAVDSAAEAQGEANQIGSLPGAWLGVLAKLEAALELGRAARIVVRRHDNGFFANFLQVLDALAAAGPAAKVEVDWRLDGAEQHFTYGEAGQDVWAALFHPLGSSLQQIPGLGPEPEPEPEPEVRVAALYAAHNPAKLPELPALLEKYGATELLRQVEPIPHHETFSTTIQPAYSSTNG